MRKIEAKLCTLFLDLNNVKFFVIETRFDRATQLVYERNPAIANRDTQPRALAMKNLWVLRNEFFNFHLSSPAKANRFFGCRRQVDIFITN